MKFVIMSTSYIRRRWYDFRQGHGIYLIFMLSFANFILIFHRLLIERVEVLEKIFPNLWIFIIVFVLLYIPIAILIGAWHRKTQLKVDIEVAVRQNPIWAKMFRTLIDIQTGKATKEEIESARKFLKSIESKVDNVW